jgi:hypothetical protein
MTASRCKSCVLGLGLIAILGLPGRLSACAVCFGRSDSPLAQGMNMGILSLLVVILSVLVACAGFFVHLARRSARLAGDSEPSAGLPPSNLPRS